MKKTSTAVVVLCCVALFGSITVIAASNMFATNNRDYSDLLFRVGQIYREYLDSREDSLLRENAFIESANFVIYESEIARIDEELRLMGREDEREQAIRFILRREVLYSEALSRGFYASDREIRDYINSNIELMRSAVNFENEMMAFFDGLGMTVEEYFESKLDIFKKEITIHKFITAERELIGTRSRLDDQEAVEDRLQSYLQSLVDNHVIANDLEELLSGR